MKCSNGTICGYATTVSAGRVVQHLDSDAKIGAIVFGAGAHDAYGCPAGFRNASNRQCKQTITQFVCIIENLHFYFVQPYSS